MSSGNLIAEARYGKSAVGRRRVGTTRIGHGATRSHREPAKAGQDLPANLPAGRCTRLRGWRSQERGGSSPPFRTTDSTAVTGTASAEARRPPEGLSPLLSPVRAPLAPHHHRHARRPDRGGRRVQLHGEDVACGRCVRLRDGRRDIGSRCGQDAIPH